MSDTKEKWKGMTFEDYLNHIHNIKTSDSTCFYCGEYMAIHTINTRRNLGEIIWRNDL